MNDTDHPVVEKTQGAFVPESEAISEIETSEGQPSSIPRPEVEVVKESVVKSPKFCLIRLVQGCYRIAYYPIPGLYVYRGTLRLDRSEATTVVSGDLYKFRSLFPEPLPVSVADLISESSDEVRATGKVFPRPFFPKLGIPIYPRRNYSSYLKVTGIQSNIWECKVTLTIEQYVYTQPPLGSHNGTFATVPRILTVVLWRKPPLPIGSTNPYYEGTVYEGGIEKGTFSMVWVSSYFRRATLEVATLQGAVSPAAVGTEDFRSVFNSINWDVNAVVNPTPLAVPSGVNPKTCWTASSLHNLMTSTVHSSDTHLDNVWHLHVLFVPGAMGCGRGLMFDTIDVPREGVVSYCDDGYPASDSSNFGTANNKKQREIPRAFLRSASHEIGHGFNQQHQEITGWSEPGADNSIMTTTPSVADFLGSSTTGAPGIFPDDIKLGFNSHVRHHLVHAPDPVIRPGGMTWQTGHNSTVPEADQELDTFFFPPDEMELKLVTMKERLKIGEPCEVDLELTNKTDLDINVPTDINPKAQHTSITVENPHGDLRLMKSFVVQTDNVTIRPLEPGKSIKEHVTIFWSSEGFAFEIPGKHTLEAKIVWNHEGIQCGVRTLTNVWLDYPTSDKDNEIASLLLTEEVGKFVALAGAPHLHKAVSRLEKAASSNPDHPACKSIANLKNYKHSSRRKR